MSTDLWLGEHGVAETVAKATGVDADTARKTIIAGIGGFATGRFTTPEEVATLITFLASDRSGQHHRRQLRDRRRPDQDNLTATTGLPRDGTPGQVAVQASLCCHSSPASSGVATALGSRSRELS